MVTRPTGTVRFARAKVVDPEGVEYEGQATIERSGVVTVLSQTVAGEVVYTSESGAIDKFGPRGWVVATPQGPVTVTKVPGGTCCGRPG